MYYSFLYLGSVIDSYIILTTSGVIVVGTDYKSKALKRSFYYTYPSTNGT
jgi:hypothetical protein